jgi:hypothetical protein
MNISIKNVIPVCLIICFIMPPSIFAFIPEQYKTLYLYAITGLYWIILLLFLKPVFLIKDNSLATSFTLIILAMSIISFLVKGELSFFNMIFPISSLAIYKLCQNYKASNSQYLFIFYFLFIYLVCYISYFSILPDFFYRPNFNEDMLYGASSNAIPLALNNSLIAYMILNYIFKWSASLSIFLISIINIFLNVIQQGRGGIIVGLILLFIAAFELNPNLFKKYKKLFSLLGIFLMIITISTILNIIDNITVSAYSLLEEKRIIAQISFFQQMSASTLVFGYPDGTMFGGETYTFNMFFDFWNKYNIFSMIFLIFFMIYRIFKRDRFLVPLYYLIPISFYMIFESIYLPSFWDFYMYIFLFLPRDDLC